MIPNYGFRGDFCHGVDGDFNCGLNVWLYHSDDGNFHHGVGCDLYHDDLDQCEDEDWFHGVIVFNRPDEARGVLQTPS